MSVVFGGSFQPLQTVRASAVLPAAGAFDAAPLELPCPGAESVILYLSYTRGAAGGDMYFNVSLSPYAVDQAAVQNWFRASVFAAGGVVSGADSLSNLQRGAVEYGSTGAAIENVVYGPLALNKSAQRLRVAFAEAGVIGTPGTVHAVALFGFDGRGVD